MRQMSLQINIEQDIEDLIPEYLSNRRDDVEQIIKFIHMKDFKEIALLAHRMRGSGSSYGFNRISELGEALEINANESNLLKIIPLLDQLKDFLDRVEIRYVQNI